jgi:hypothetical protein
MTSPLFTPSRLLNKGARKGIEKKEAVTMKKLMVLVAMMVMVLTAAVPAAFAQEVEDGAHGTVASQQYSVEERTVNFELAVEGTPPADATFFGKGPLTGLPVRLADPDGDNTYAGTTTVGVTVNPDGTTQPAPIAIFGGVGTTPGGTNPRSKFPGSSSLVVKDFGPTVIEDGQTFKASIYFGEITGGTATTGVTAPDSMTPDSGNGDPGNSGNPDSDDEAKALPETSGAALPILGVAGALLVGGGFLIRRLVL